jgi:hypothetical protein
MKKKSLKKAQLGTIAKTIAGATKGAVRGGKTAYKSAKKAETANLKNIEDWDAYRATKSDRRLKTALAVPTAVTLAAMTYDKKNQNNKKKVEANKAKVQANKQKVAANAAKYKKAGGSVKSLEKAQLGKIVKMASTALKGSSKFPEQKTLTKADALINTKSKKNLKNIQKNYNKPVPKFPEQKTITKEQVMKNMAKRKSKKQ